MSKEHDTQTLAQRNNLIRAAVINQGVNYGITFVGYSVAAFFAPKVAVGMAGQSGDFSKAFYVAIVIALVGIVLNFTYVQLKKRAN
ncbi:hypothetical protein H7R52_16885 [Weissella confusa]|uniref:MFS transporter n=1 Tax=Weissella confusa TaxID=1583 RepID=A0A923NFM4_WEICO|nr:hypothetical protein [Weissella confusa]